MLVSGDIFQPSVDQRRNDSDLVIQILDFVPIVFVDQIRRFDIGRLGRRTVPYGSLPV
jgi:hypothetical protein